jgi:hypothetical protein
VRTARTGETPFPQRIHDDGSNRNLALARFGLGLADLVVTVGALPHGDLAALEIDIRPSGPRNSDERKPLNTATSSSTRLPCRTSTLTVAWYSSAFFLRLKVWMCRSPVAST